MELVIRLDVECVFAMFPMHAREMLNRNDNATTSTVQVSSNNALTLRCLYKDILKGMGIVNVKIISEVVKP